MFIVAFHYIVKVKVNRFIYQFGHLLYPRTSNDFLLIARQHWSKSCTMLREIILEV